MASSSSSPSAPTFSSYSWNYDVFLSFRGEDTRLRFVDHLYTALEQQGINTYKDDVTLPRGESIGPSLLKDIEQSQIALIIFSENYGDSSWCLEELAHIMKCRDTRGQTVMPIFYDVDPSVVRKQKGKYKEAFSKHVLENRAKVESWRKALMDASSISGWEPKNIASGHEAQGIKQIVFEISLKLHPVTSSATEKLVGMAARLQSLKSELEIASSGVRMVGIWGIGGGGKTTLASSLYDDIRRQFNGCCFVENIREESSRYGLRKLEEKILSELKVNIVGGGRHLINNRFRQRKVLLVLDDVDHLEQLRALAGSHDWFGEGSRIIITTRNQHLLYAHRVHVTLNISLLNDNEAIELFCKQAPRRHIPTDDYELLSKRVVSYAGGLPLALTILGCFLCDKDAYEWRNALDKLEEILDADILKVLKISYDGLEQVQKDLFLDIACFFRRVNKDKAMKMHVACGFRPVTEVKVLIEKALITISEDGKFDMHNLVQQMAHNIVIGNYRNNPAKHSRVWKKGDVLKLCSMGATTDLDMIEAIRFRCNGADPLQRLPVIVANMKNVRWIDWVGDLVSPLPANFSPSQLCCLTLEGISQTQLWEGHKELLNLKMMELCGLRKLTVTPNFNGLPNLERFKLTKCFMDLEDIDSSIGCLESLAFLSIEECLKLKMFPPITRLVKLETLTFKRCPKLFKHFEIQQPNMNHIGLQFKHRGLRELVLSFCNLGDKEINSVDWELPKLQKLDLKRNKFSQLNFSRLQLPQLKWLNISDCDRLLVLSMLPSSIAVIIADGCTSLDNFGDVSNCKWLWNVSHLKGDKLGGDTLIYYMLQGNAIEDHFISVTLEHYDPKWLVGRLYMRETFTLPLPPHWYNDFNGFLICIVTDMICPNVNILIKHEALNEDIVFEHWQESDEAREPDYHETTTSVGYVSFEKLGITALLSSSYNIISFSIKDRYLHSKATECYIGAELIPRKSKGIQVNKTKVATNCSEFWDEESGHGNTYTIKHGTESSIKLQWFPYIFRPKLHTSPPFSRL